MSKREMERQHHMFNALQSIGFTFDEAQALRRISIRLQHWFEKECGIDNGCIERDEETGKTYWLNAMSGKRYRCRDLETGARKRLAAIIGQRNGRAAIVDGRLNAAPSGKVDAYIQGDPRGAALYILRPGDVPEGKSADGFYSRGICVY